VIARGIGDGFNPLEPSTITVDDEQERSKLVAMLWDAVYVLGEDRVIGLTVALFEELRLPR